jgi:hypothetical protein
MRILRPEHNDPERKSDQNAMVGQQSVDLKQLISIRTIVLSLVGEHVNPGLYYFKGLGRTRCFGFAPSIFAAGTYNMSLARRPVAPISRREAATFDVSGEAQ